MDSQTDTGEDEKWMRLAIGEARKGIGLTRPNPAVGAVIVRKGRLLARGWHRLAGLPHAEIETLNALKNPALAGKATLYVTLEPCSTRGKTPPCTEAILRAGFQRVVYGATDPNPRHAGRADGILREGGVEVCSGILAAECRNLNSAWNKWIVTGMPFVLAKAGMSLDGRIASPAGRRWITSPEARADAMRLRAASDAILVGGETIRTDNPRLTLRGCPGVPQPWRVVWTKSGEIPASSKIFSDRWKARTLVFRDKPLRAVLKELGGLGVQQVLIEGGGRTLGEAVDRRLVDRFVIYMAPVLLGGPVPAIGGRGAGSNESSLRLDRVSYKLVGGNLRIEADVP